MDDRRDEGVRAPANYYDIDDILAQAAHITCTFNKNTPKDLFPLIGIKAPESIDEKGFKAEAPLWIVPYLKTCTLNLPTAYNTGMQNVLLANAAFANLERMQQCFYGVGVTLCRTIGSDAVKLAECLLETFVQRIPGIITKAYYGQNKPEKMDIIERELYEECLESRKDLRNWLSGSKS